MRMLVTVLSDDLIKAKEFANFLMSSESDINKRDTKYEMSIYSNRIHCRALTPKQLSRGMRHNKFYIDSKTDISDEIYNSLIMAKILPIFLGKSSLHLKIENPIEVVDFDSYLKV